MGIGMKKQKKLTTCLSFLIILLLIFLSAGCKILPSGKTSNLSIQTASADKHKLQANLDVAGVLVPAETVNVMSKMSGQVKSLNVDVGSMVNAGDIVAVLDTKELNAQLQQAEAALKSAYDQASQAKVNLEAAESAYGSNKQLLTDQASQAKINMDEAEQAYNSTKQLLSDQEAQAKLNLDAAERTYNRTKELAESGAATQSQLDEDQSKYDLAKKQYDMARVDTGSSAQNQLLNAQNKYEQAKKQYEMAVVDTGSSAQNQLLAASSKVDLAKKQYDTASGSTIEQAQAAVNTIRVQLDNANVVSMASGIVTNKNVNAGENVSAGGTLFTIAKTSTLKLKGTVAQEAVPLLNPGQEIDVSVDIYPGKTYQGQIDSIGPTAVNTGVYFPIEISIQNSGDIKAGLSAHASIGIATEEGVAVPVSAVIQNNGQNYVFVIKDNFASKRVVTTGLKNDKEIVILKGIEAGEKVATTNVNNLFDNMPVHVN